MNLEKVPPAQLATVQNTSVTEYQLWCTNSQPLLGYSNIVTKS